MINIPSLYADTAAQIWPCFRHDPQHTGLSPYAGPQTSNLRWQIGGAQNVVTSSPAIGPDGTILIGYSDPNRCALYALVNDPDPNQKVKVKWSFTTGGNIISTPAIGQDGTIYFGYQDKNIYALDPNGTQKWNYPIEGEVSSSPVIGPDGTIYVPSNDHDVYSLDPNGTPKWRYKTNAPVGTSPAIGADGTVYIASGDGVVYAFGPPSPVLSVTPDGEADFGEVQIGDSIDLTFTVKNTGEGTLSGNASILPPFYIISGNSYELDTNQSQEVLIRFTPDEALYYNEDLVFRGGGWATRKLTGQGLSTCTCHISPKSKAINCSGGMGSIEVNTQKGCSWTALSNCTWIRITSGKSGDASGLLQYRVLPNPEDLQRTGTITIAGHTFTIHQAKAYPARLSITPPYKELDSQAGEITFVINNTGSGTMDWTVSDLDGDWMQISSGASGTNSGTIKVSYRENKGCDRTGRIKITAGDSIGCSDVEGSPATITIIQQGSGITCYRDYDEDGYGDPDHSIEAPSCPEGYTDNNLDCNDKDDTINPEAREILDDGIDNNCNGETDETCIFMAEITATGQTLNDPNIVYHNTDTVTIGIDTYAMAEEAPPSPPDNTVVLTLAGDEYKLKKDIRGQGPCSFRI